MAEAELLFLEQRNNEVVPPTTGPVKTADIADCLMMVTYALLGDRSGTLAFHDLAATGPTPRVAVGFSGAAIGGHPRPRRPRERSPAT